MFSIWALRIRFEIRGSWIILKEVPMILVPLLMICGSGSQLSRRSPNEAQTHNGRFVWCCPNNFLNWSIIFWKETPGAVTVGLASLWCWVSWAHAGGTLSHWTRQVLLWGIADSSALRVWDWLEAEKKLYAMNGLPDSGAEPKDWVNHDRMTPYPFSKSPSAQLSVISEY